MAHDVTSPPALVIPILFFRHRLDAHADYPRVLQVRVLGHPSDPEAHPERLDSAPSGSSPAVAHRPHARGQLRGWGRGLCAVCFRPSNYFERYRLRSGPFIVGTDSSAEDPFLPSCITNSKAITQSLLIFCHTHVHAYLHIIRTLA